MNSYLIVSIITVIIIQIVVTLIVFERKLHVFINLLFALLLITPYAIHVLFGVKVNRDVVFISYFILAFFPVYFSLMLQNKLFYNYFKSILFMYLLTGFNLVAVFFSIYALQFMLLTVIIVGLYSLYLMRYITDAKVRFVYLLSLLFLITVTILDVLFLPVVTSIYFPILYIIILTFVFIYKSHRRLSLGFYQVSDVNKKLIHTATRLKQSNEQVRRIILEKDTELYQLARHASLAELTAGIAHELSQPLTGIKGIAQNMIDDIEYNEFEQKQGVSELVKISSLVDKSTVIIDHIRNFSRKNVFVMKYLTVNTMLQDAIELVHVQLKKNGIGLILELQEDLPKVYADKISMEQLFLNIIINAKDAILDKHFKEEEQGLISITTQRQAEQVKIIISDNGSGIPDDIKDKIWSPFFTTKKRNHGTGIGLSISHKILVEHNGNVAVESSKKGTTFTISMAVAI